MQIPNSVVIAKPRTDWQNLSTRQLAATAREQDLPALARMADTHREMSGKQMLESVRGKRDVLRFLATPLLLFSGFMGCLAVGATAAVPLAVAAGVGGLASLGTALSSSVLTGRLKGAEEQGPRVAEGFLHPKPDGTFESRLFQEGGKFSELAETRRQEDGAVLARHARLGKTLELREDVLEHTVYVTTPQRSYPVKGQLQLPDADHPNLVLTSLEPEGLSQVFRPDGSSLLQCRSQLTWLPLTEVNLSVEQWTDGTVCLPATNTLLTPFVTSEELGAKVPHHRRGEVAKPDEAPRSVWNLDCSQIPGPGHEAVSRVVSMTDVVARSGDVSLRLAQGKLTMVRGLESYSVEGHYEQNLIVKDNIRQAFTPGSIQLRCQVPEGRVEIRHDQGGDPQAQLFWGDTPRGLLPALEGEDGVYEVRLQDQTYRLKPILGQELLFQA